MVVILGVIEQTKTSTLEDTTLAGILSLFRSHVRQVEDILKLAE